MDRRNFSRTGGMVVLSSLVMSSLVMPESVRGALRKTDHESVVVAAINRFGVTETNLKKVMAAALEKGSDYADFYFEYTFNNDVSLMDGKTNGCGSNIDSGMRVYVLAGGQNSYAYVEDVTLEEMLRTTRITARIVSSGKADRPTSLTAKTIAQNRYAAMAPWEDVNVKGKIPYLGKLNKKISSLDDRVRKVQAYLQDNTSYVLFCNSEGISYYNYRPMVSFIAVCIMEEDGKMENGYTGRSCRKGFEFITDDVVDVIARKMMSRTAILFKAIKPKGGEMPVVMGSGGSGISLHEAIGHAFEADFNRKDISTFSSQLNRKVCSEHINVVDDDTIPSSRDSVSFDDEGVEEQKTYIVREGVLINYLHGRINAKHYGVNPTGNGRRDTFRNLPILRIHVTYIEAGNIEEVNTISTVKNGILVDTFTNDQMQVGAGDSTFFMKSGYLIEDGKLAQPIKDINIIGNGPEALADITTAADNDKTDSGTWTCGKNGQPCPATCDVPSALVSKLTVGGES